MFYSLDLANLIDRDLNPARHENMHIRHLRDFDDTIYQAPHSAPLFEDIRGRLGMAELAKINDIIY